MTTFVCEPMHTTLADRVWYALHCLPRDENGKPPAGRVLEREHGLATATISHTISGRKTNHYPETFARLARALRVSPAWLHGDPHERGPVPTGMIPPRPGTQWARYGDIPGWSQSVDICLLDPVQRVPREAFLAGADLPVYRPADMVTPALAVAVAAYAWETATADTRARYSTAVGREASAGGAVRRPMRKVK